MTNYTSDLETWGSTGSPTPVGFSHLAGDQSIAEYENDFKYHATADLDHLITLTNNRLDSGTGTAYPASPTAGNLFWRSDLARAAVYNASTLAWKTLAYKSEVDSVVTNLSNHEADTANPHAVTAAQVGATPAAHETNTTNPHSVTAAQVSAVAKAGDTMSGTLDMSAGRLVLPVGLDKYATQ